eukprot:TRINITY_DN11504_c0_g1_i1.p1 TRINITY_DN11504_c0_g1~~TRINITY_DN11504_c0_g1_i1.p1  ORF type:complete len:731 (-),score=114.86 TRINITY_DN11504_c0_g1_i1:64-2256(-)
MASAAAEAAQPATVSTGPNIAAIEALEVNHHIGPDVNLPWTALPPLSVDNQLADTVTRLRAQQEVQRKVDEAVRNRSPTLTKIQKGQYKTHVKSGACASNANQVLALQHDERFIELQNVLSQKLPEQGDQPNTIRGTLNLRFDQELRQGVRNLLDSVKMASDPDAARKQLDSAYKWYKSSRKPGKVDRNSGPAPQDFSDYLSDDNFGERRLPGSGFYQPPVDTDLPERSRSTTNADELQFTGSPMVAGRPITQVELAPPHERLKDFHTRQLVKPLTARRLKAANLTGDYDHKERPLTPSTATGGYTGRSVSSMRSSPVMGSRPGSAMSSFTVHSGVSGSSIKPPSTPRSSSYRPGHHRPASAASVTSTASGPQVPGLPLPLPEDELFDEMEYYSGEEGMEMTLPPYPATVAEHRMEQRWLVRRNRAIVNQGVGEEQRTAVKNWAERRARVEEEISRNTEAARFQSDLQRRAYKTPDDAEEDIAPTVPECEAEEENLAVHAPAARVTARPPPPRINATQPQGYTFHGAARFEDDEPVKPRPKAKALSSKIAHLRKLHATLIRDTEAQENTDDEGSVDDEQEATSFTLSPYATARGDKKPCAPRMEDDSDVLVGLCDWWRDIHGMDPPTPGDSGVTLTEIRYQQLKEVEEIKRAFARNNVPLSVAVLERAMVMPAHKLQPGAFHGTNFFNTTPNLMTNPYAVKYKKKGKKKGKKGAKKGAKSPGPKKKQKVS